MKSVKTKGKLEKANSGDSENVSGCQDFRNRWTQGNMQSFQVVLVVKSPPTNAGDIRDVGSVPGSGGPPEDSVATHSRVLVGMILWTEEPGGPQSTGSVDHD